MSELCSIGLREAMAPPASSLIFSYAFGLVGIWGWGRILRRWLSSADAPRTLIAHDFLTGFAVVALIRHVTSLTGWCNSSWAIAITGIGLGLFTLLQKRFCNGGRQAPAIVPHEKSPLLVGILFWFGLLVTGYISFTLMLSPLPAGDMTSIWGLHGKALTCECLFDAHYVLEPYWGVSHPDYPVFYPHIMSYFWTLSGSWRDDLINFWQAIVISAAYCVIWWTVWDKYRSALLCMVATALPIFVWSIFEWNAVGVFESLIISLSALSALMLASHNWRRFGIYLFIFALSKNECFVFAILLLGFLWFEWLIQCWRTRSIITPAILSGPLIGTFSVLIWALTLPFLPQRHENYPSHILSLDAWRTGIVHARGIIHGCIYFIKDTPLYSLYIWAFCIALLASIRNQAARRLLIWLIAAAAFLFSIYMVSPWGVMLFAITFRRIATAMSGVAIIAIVIGLGHFMYRRIILKQIISIALIYICYGYVWELKSLYTSARSEYRRNKGILSVPTIDWYNRAHDFWRPAFVLDEVAPRASAIGMLRQKDFLLINYLLYPRRIYAAPPSLPAATLAPWENWTAITAEQQAMWGIYYAFDGSITGWPEVVLPLKRPSLP